MYINGSSGETRLQSENLFPAEHYNVTFNLDTSVTLHNDTAQYIIDEGWPWSEKGVKLLLHFSTELSYK